MPFLRTPPPEGEGAYNLRRSKRLRVYPAFTGFFDNPRIKLRTGHRSSQPPFFFWPLGPPSSHQPLAAKGG